MKLRNKKTGETRVFYYLHPTIPNGSVLLGLLDDDWESQTYTYGSLADFNEEWEDYKPAEPYIKDKKVRKFVREWAEINGIETVLVCETFNAWGFKNKTDGKAGDKEYMLADILFKGEKPEELEFGKEYSITELCGEEQE